MSIFLDRIVGRRITGLVVTEGRGPAASLFLSFDDATYYEFYWDHTSPKDVEICDPHSGTGSLSVCLDPQPGFPRARRNQEYLDVARFGRTVRVWLGDPAKREGPAPDLSPLQRALGHTVRGAFCHQIYWNWTLLAILLDDQTYLEFHAFGPVASTKKIDIADHTAARSYAAKMGTILLDAEYQPCTTEVVQ